MITATMMIIAMIIMMIIAMIITTMMILAKITMLIIAIIVRYGIRAPSFHAAVLEYKGGREGSAVCSCFC